MIHQGTTTEIGFATLDVKNRRTCEYDMEVGVGVVNLLQLARPSVVLMYFINVQMRATLFYEVVGKTHKMVGGKIHMIGRDIEVHSLCMM